MSRQLADRFERKVDRSGEHHLLDRFDGRADGSGS